ncbi:PPOX class F420-dependent oxidoreductase [Jonesia quinghaiensis]|uniref:PPOX class F420-dependent oxidoreductase n=1 Tax=Jonesia quinghaiensis TaxID=262806 RepID=UPI00040F5E5E|nr:PPOX class F420-dependent oxidoreductase [Jonesia quinghaiensis]
MARNIATNTRVEFPELTNFLRGNRHAVFLTYRRSGEPQMSPVVFAVDSQGRILVSTYPDRAKAVNVRRDARAAACILGADFDDAWVQVSGRAEVIDLPESVDVLVDYYRAAAGEHPDWDEYRSAMLTQGKSVIRLTIETWGPVATGGFPAHLVSSSTPDAQGK